MKHLVFIVAYLYFLINDIYKRKISTRSIMIYGIISAFAFMIGINNMTQKEVIDSLFSILFGMLILAVAIISKEGIGKGDGFYFLINGLLLSFKENFSLFISGLLVAFMLSIFIFFFKGKNKNLSIPFIPCFLPAILGYIICTV